MANVIPAERTKLVLPVIVALTCGVVCAMWIFVANASLGPEGSAPEARSMFTPRADHTKVIAKYLFQQVNASAAANVIVTNGGDVIDENDHSLLAYVPNEFLDRLLMQAATAGIEIRVHSEFDTIQFPNGVIDTRIGVERSAPGQRLSPPYRPYEYGLYLVQFVGPVATEWLTALRERDIAIIQYLPYNAFIVATLPQQIGMISNLPYVQFVDIMHAFIKPQAVPKSQGTGVDLIVQIAGIDQAEDTIAEVSRLSQKPVTKSRPLPEEIRIEGRFDAADVDTLLSMPLVFGIAVVPQGGLSDERVALSMTRNSTPSAVFNPTTYAFWLNDVCPYCTSLQSDTFWIGLADSGLDSGTASGNHHADLPSSRIKYGANLMTAGQPLDDTLGHGTAVASIAAGGRPLGGVDSTGFYFGQGVAPSAGVFVTKLNFMAGQTASVFESAGDAVAANPKVYVQNHSYNQYYAVENFCFGGSYSLWSRDFDIASADANGESSGITPITLTVSAGNQFQDTQCASVQRLTLPPATAKNVISMGMAENVRASNEGWGCHESGFTNFNNIAAASKRGTGLIGWFKPDLFAPAANVGLARSTNAGSIGPDSFCQASGVFPASPPLPTDYVAGAGTSFAAPVAAGAAILARRAYAERIAPNCHSGCDAGAASPALVKAMLVASARSMKGGTSFSTSGTTSQSIASIPNDEQGFGRIHLEDLFARYPYHYYFNEGYTFTTATGNPQWTKTLAVHDVSLPVKVVLVWTDRPALENETSQIATTLFPLINDLDLSVELGTPCSTRYVGNQIDATTELSVGNSCTTGTFDNKNNVELVTFIPEPSLTQFTIRVAVTSGNIDFQHVQRFAVVAYNAYDSDSPPPAVPENMHANVSGSQVTISWTASSNATQDTQYELQKKTAANPFAAVITSSAVTYIDSAVSSGAAYAYRVRAVTTTTASAWSPVDLATLVSFSDDPLQTLNVVKAVHIGELRTAINLVRALADLGSASFTDPSITAGVSTVKAAHIQELRVALGAARAALNAAAIVYTDAPVTAGSVIKASHIVELRQAIQ